VGDVVTRELFPFAFPRDFLASRFEKADIGYSEFIRIYRQDTYTRARVCLRHYKSGSHLAHMRYRRSRNKTSKKKERYESPHACDFRRVRAPCHERGCGMDEREHAGAAIAGPPEGRCRQMAGRCLQSCPDCRSGRGVSRP